jgi:hypothetical protein
MRHWLCSENIGENGMPNTCSFKDVAGISKTIDVKLLI